MRRFIHAAVLVAAAGTVAEAPASADAGAILFTAMGLHADHVEPPTVRSPLLVRSGWLKAMLQSFEVVAPILQVLSHRHSSGAN